MEDMTRSEIEALFGRVDDENARQNKRLDKLEDIIEKINVLAEATTKLATSVEAMQKEVEKQGRRVEALEAEPADNWRSAIKTVITVVVSAIVTYLLARGGI